MDNIFASVFSGGSTSAGLFLLCVAMALISGAAFAFACFFKSESTKSFFVSIALLPATVAVVIMLVNGNVGAGVAVAGAFSLVRFRSASGTAKEICMIFIAMASGLAFGMGYIAFGVLFLVIAGGALIAFSALKIWEKRPNLKNKQLCVTIPEDLDYTSVFDDVFDRYTEKHELLKVKTVNFGSMFRVKYAVTLKNAADEKAFIDEIRRLNGNLEVLLERIDLQQAEL